MRAKSGIAIVATLVILVLVGLLVFGTFYTTQIEQFVTRNDATSTQANYIAQAGLQKYKTALFQNFRWALENLDPVDLNACDNILSIGIDWDRNGSGLPGNFPQEFTDNIGGGVANVRITRDPRRPRFITITSVGTFAGARSSVRAVFDITNAGLFKYGLVIGQGSNQRAINGSPTVYGGVFIEGTPPVAGQSYTPPRVMTGSGNLTVLNNFNLNADAQGELRSFTNRSAITSARDLCSSFRVRWGTVEVQSNSVGLGEPNPPGYNPATDANNQLLDIRVGDLQIPVQTDNALIYNNQNQLVDRGCQANSGFCALSVGRYDISDQASPRFPRLDDLVNSDRCLPLDTWRTCIQRDARVRFVATRLNSFTMPALPTGIGAAWNDEVGCRTFLQNSTNVSNTSEPEIVLGSSTSFNCTYRTSSSANAGGFAYDAGTGILRVYGTVNLAGFNIRTSRQVEYQAYGYNSIGRSASLFLERVSVARSNGTQAIPRGGSFRLGANFVPDNSTQFPTQTLALIAEDDVLYTGANNMTAMGIIYAQDQFAMSGSQSTFVGTAVANVFCSQSNCSTGGSASLFYVDPSSNLPFSMRISPSTKTPVFRVLSYERF